MRVGRVLALSVLLGGYLSAAGLSDGTVYAGQNGAQGFSGDGGSATSADLNAPTGLAVDSKGNLYIADSLNNRVRKVDTGGIITTFAGNGSTPTSAALGDGQPATSVPLPLPCALAVDGTDNIYIYVGASPGGVRIAKVDGTGIITTAVPGSVLSNFNTALLLGQSENNLSMAVDRGGSTIWLSTAGQILKISVASGTVTTIPTGNSQLAAMAQAPNGDLYYNSVPAGGNPFLPAIVRMSATTGAVTTVFNSQVPASVDPSLTVPAQPTALAVDSAGIIYFAQASSVTQAANAIFRVDTSGSATQVAATANNIPLIIGNSFALDASGNLYFSEVGSTVHRLAAAASSKPAPAITPGGIVPAGSTTSTIQSGEWIAIYGSNLATSTATWAGDFPISLGGTTVTIDGKPAYLSYVSSGQINLQVPDDSAIGSVPVVVTTASGSSSSTVALATVAPSFLLLDGKHVAGIILRSDGSGAYGGGAYDIVGPTGISLGYRTVAAKAGDFVELFGTGFGPTSPTVLAGRTFSGSAPTTNPVQLTIGGRTVTPSFAGLSGAGLVQINFTVPAGIGSGDLALTGTVAGATTPSNVVLSLQ